LSFAVGGRDAVRLEIGQRLLIWRIYNGTLRNRRADPAKRCRGIVASRMLAVFRSVAESVALFLGPRCWLKFRVADYPRNSRSARFRAFVARAAEVFRWPSGR
jgi:hypothetical protein